MTIELAESLFAGGVLAKLAGRTERENAAKLARATIERMEISLVAASGACCAG
jgi:hypothetical protein